MAAGDNVSKAHLARTTPRIAARRLLVLAFSPLLVCATLASEPRVAPLPVEDITALKSVSPYDQPAFSKDGEWLAYVLEDPQRAQELVDEKHPLFTPSGIQTLYVGCDIWVTNIRKGESQLITGGKGTNIHPVWSPDGKYLAFLSDREGYAGVWLWEKNSGTLRQVSSASLIVSYGDTKPIWASDSTKIIVAVVPEGMSVDAELALIDMSAPHEGRRGNGDTGPLVYTAQAIKRGGADTSLHDGTTLTSHPFPVLDLALIEIPTGRMERLIKDASPRSLRLSPDGRRLAFLNFKRMDLEGGFGQIYDLAYVDLRTGRSKMLVHEIKESQGSSLSWSPDSYSVAYATFRARGEAFVVSADGNTPRQIIRAEQVEVDTDESPLWDKSGAMLYFQGKDGRSIWSVRISDDSPEQIANLVSYHLEGIVRSSASPNVLPAEGRWIETMARDEHSRQLGIYRVDLKTHRFSQLLGGEGQMIGSALLSPDGSQVVWKQQDASHPADLWIADGEFTNPRHLTHSNPAIDSYILGKTRSISWSTARGEVLHGGLILPAGYREGEKYPLVVCAYGGVAISEDVNEFSGTPMCDFNLQLLATRGYAVLFADSIARQSTPMSDLAGSILPGIDRTIELGIADADHVGIMGQSYGAYTVLALIAQSQRFKAASSVDGMSDLIAQYSQMNVTGQAYWIEWAENGQGNLGGSPWQYRDRYIDNSPFYYFDHIQTPVLLIHGTNDQAVPSWLGDQTFVGLRRLGKEVTYVKYHGGHTSDEWSYADRVDYCNRVIAWFDRFLKPSVTPQASN